MDQRISSGAAFLTPTSGVQVFYLGYYHHRVSGVFDFLLGYSPRILFLGLGFSHGSLRTIFSPGVGEQRAHLEDPE